METIAVKCQVWAFNSSQREIDFSSRLGPHKKLVNAVTTHLLGFLVVPWDDLYIMTFISMT